MKVVSTKKWTIEIYNDGTVRLKRANDGFSIFEFGILKITELDIAESKGIVKPDIVERTMIKL